MTEGSRRGPLCQLPRCCDIRVTHFSVALQWLLRDISRRSDSNLSIIKSTFPSISAAIQVFRLSTMHDIPSFASSWNRKIIIHIIEWRTVRMPGVQFCNSSRPPAVWMIFAFWVYDLHSFRRDFQSELLCIHNTHVWSVCKQKRKPLQQRGIKENHLHIRGIASEGCIQSALGELEG